LEIVETNHPAPMIRRHQGVLGGCFQVKMLLLLLLLDTGRGTLYHPTTNKIYQQAQEEAMTYAYVIKL
jgi:hypothetical protein